MAGFDNDVVYGTNVDFTGTSPVSGQINQNGELLVGASVAPFIRAYVPTGSNGVSIIKGAGTLDFSLSSIPNSALANSTINVIAGTGLLGGGLTSLGNSVSLALSTPVSVINGGTGLTSTTINQILYSSAANTITGLATANNGTLVTSSAGVPSILAGPGVTGTILQSNAAAAPSFSTATYPSTATGTSKVLVADGTNWVASTPTFPNASATLNKVIKSDGTNWIASTETYAAPGTSGNVMTSDGTNWTSAAGSGILIAASQITSAQVKALHGTPIQVIAAPGNGKVIQLISAIGTMNYGGTNVFVAGASQTIQLTYGTIGSQTAGMVLLANGDIVAAASQIHQGNIILNTTTYASIQNTAVNLYNSSATEISGNAAGNNTVSYSVVYRIVTIP